MASQSSHQDTNPAGARALVADDTHVVIDVRTVEEFESGHIPGAYNIPLMFRTITGMTPNEDFLGVMKQRFRPEASLVFV